MLQLRFKFDPTKSLAAMSHVLERVGPTDKVKLMKLIYLADRSHFVETGVPITGDKLVAMRFGPVPSLCLDLVNGYGPVPADQIYKIIHVVDNTVSAVGRRQDHLLSQSERQHLDRVADEFSGTQSFEVVRWTHQLPEYTDHYREGTSTPIPFESIARHGANASRFIDGRVVVSAVAAGRLEMRYVPADPDL